MPATITPTASLKNPVDVIGDARDDRYRAALDAVTADENVDQVMVLVTPQSMTNIREIAEVIGESKQFCGKPVTACLMGLEDVADSIELLQNKYGVPTYAFPENGMRAMAAQTRFAEWIRTPTHDYRPFDMNDDALSRLFDAEREAGRNQLVEIRALEALTHCGFPLVPFKLATTADEAAAGAGEMGYPVVMKISGPKILHKTDVGGVKLNLTDEPAVRQAYDGMMAEVREKLGDDIEVWGVVVQKMLDPGKEIILGVRCGINSGR